MRFFDGDVAFGSQQDFGQIAGETAINGSHGKRLGPHRIVGKAVRADERGGGKIAAEFTEFGKVN
jgi:hypothetical protein